MEIESKRGSVSLFFLGFGLGWKKKSKKREKEIRLKLVLHKGDEYFVNF